jgi:hypothetical protein
MKRSWAIVLILLLTLFLPKKGSAAEEFSIFSFDELSKTKETQKFILTDFRNPLKISILPEVREGCYFDVGSTTLSIPIGKTSTLNFIIMRQMSNKSDKDTSSRMLESKKEFQLIGVSFKIKF